MKAFLKLVLLQMLALGANLNAQDAKESPTQTAQAFLKDAAYYGAVAGSIALTTEAVVKIGEIISQSSGFGSLTGAAAALCIYQLLQTTETHAHQASWREKVAAYTATTAIAYVTTEQTADDMLSVGNIQKQLAYWLIHYGSSLFETTCNSPLGYCRLFARDQFLKNLGVFAFTGSVCGSLLSSIF